MPCGPDGLPSVLYNKLSKSHPLSLIFESFISIGKVPDEWRSAIVTPVHKGGLVSIISNCRPISPICIASKIIKRVVVNLLTYLRHCNLISKQQHGFLSCKSSTTNILESLADWTLTLKNRHLVDICKSISPNRSILSVKRNYFINFVSLA